jgi:hypothetical protein
MFRRIILPPSSEPKSEPRNKLAKAGDKIKMKAIHSSETS